MCDALVWSFDPFPSRKVPGSSVKVAFEACQLVTIVSRQLGYKSTSPQLRRVILDRCENLVRAGRLKSSGGAFSDGLICR